MSCRGRCRRTATLWTSRASASSRARSATRNSSWGVCRGPAARSCAMPVPTRPKPQHLSDEEVRELAKLGRRIERHYGPLRTRSGHTTQTTAPGSSRPGPSRPWGSHRGAGRAAGATGAVARPRRRARLRRRAGRVRVVSSLSEAGELADGDVLVAHMTTPDWVPLMRRAAAIVTDSGGMTCHAAIVSRELGIPCLVGTGGATETLRDGELVTVDAGKGVVLEGELPAEPHGPCRARHPPGRPPQRWSQVRDCS
jgi:pyruvate, water dikinase